MKMNKYECHCSDTVCKLESNKRPTFCHYYSHIAPDWQLVNAEVPKLERWKPQVGESYWMIELYPIAVVNQVTSDGFNKDDNLYNCGNCFRTKEDAEKALEMVRELLLSFHGEVKPKGTRKDYIDVLKHYVCTEVKGVKLETLVKVVELMTKDVIGDQSNVQTMQIMRWACPKLW